MIDVSTIENVAELEQMKKDLNFFINKKIIADIYKENGEDPIALLLDRDLARTLLSHVIARIQLLTTRAKH